MKHKFKGLIAISDVLDDRYKKLCVRYHTLVLSHKRQERLLRQWLSLMEDARKFGDSPEVYEKLAKLQEKTKIELEY